MLSPLRHLPVLACAVIVLAGCGNSRAPVLVNATTAAPKGFHRFQSLRAGAAFKVPANWTVGPGAGALIATISSGPATVALWRYPRSQPPPVGAATLARARASLVSAARQRDPTLELIRTSTGSMLGLSVIQLNAIERIGSQRRRVRSLHLFVGRSELVLEEYAPVADFHAIDHTVFSPLSHSLRLLPTAK